MKPFHLSTGIRVGKATIYGTDWCGFTTKQRKEFDDKHIDYDYIDCDKNKQQCAGISAFPVVKNFSSQNLEWEGYRPV